MRAMMASTERMPATRPQRAGSLRSNSSKGSKAARLDMRRDSRPLTENSSAARRDSGMRTALDSPGQPLSQSIRPAMEAQLGFDFSKVRIHNDAHAVASASALNAEAYTSGSHIVFGAGQFNLASSTGRALLAHELAHVTQQGANESRRTSVLEAADSESELQADRAATRAPGNFDLSRAKSGTVEPGTVEPGTIQRKLSARDVGRGEQSGFARVPELITRLNTMSTGLVFAVTGSELTYTVKPGGTLSNFDTQMQGFIDQAAVIPLRFTNRHGLTGNKQQGFNDRVQVDDYSSGYVDIDDLLASNDLGLQSALVHFLRERSSTSNYAHRIGSESLKTGDDTPEHIAHQAEFDRSHNQGIQAELEVLRGFFNDPSIRLITGADSGDVFRVFRNSRRDTIRTRVRQGRGAETGVDAVNVEVVTRDGKVHTPEEYKAILAAAAVAAPGQGAPGPASVGRAPNAPP
jgi:hypothetical protein